MADAFVFAALMLAAPAEAPMALEGLIGFSDPARCEPAAPFRRLLDALWDDGRGTFLGRDAVPASYRGAFTHAQFAVGINGHRIASIGTTGTWHGVPLLGYELAKMPADKAPTLEIHFGVPMAAARDVLSARGFRFGASGDGPRISLRTNLSDDSTTILTCAPRG